MAIPTCIGWLFVRLCEQNQPVLLRVERWFVGHVLGTTATMCVFFLGEVLGVLEYSMTNLLLVSTVLLIGLSMLYMRLRVYWSNTPPALPTSAPLTNKKKLLLGALAAWTTVKIANAGFLLVASPPYLDDVFNNWNMRGKLFYVTQELHLSSEIGVSSYPPTVSLVKTWLAFLAGEWHEGLVNAPHILWYMCALGLLFFFLRRLTNVFWAGIGTYGLSSLPLYAVHSAHAYADIFVSVHVFIILSCLYNSQLQSAASSLSWLRLASIASGLLIMTKNEALLLHLPVCLALLGYSVYVLQKKNIFDTTQTRTALMHSGMSIACVLLPWLLFKWTHNLTFGNAKAVSGLAVEWQPGVAKAIWVNTFFEGNWIALFPLLITAIVWRWRDAWRGSMVVLTTYIIALLALQLPLYFFTSLSTEAIQQTGLARGFVQLAPVMVALVILLSYRKYTK